MTADGNNGPKISRRGPAERTSLASSGPPIYFQACKLIRIDGPGRGEEYAIEEGDTIVGSSNSADVTIAHPTMSRRHFVVRRDGQSYQLEDLESTNGTSIDDLRVQNAYLRPGALIKAGEVFFRFELNYTAADVAPSESRQFGRLIGDSVRLRQIFAVLEKVAPTESTVLIQGETGTGKGAVARTIHAASSRKKGALVVFDCGSIAPNLLESELFGHEKGAFTGAVNRRSGALEEARGGTLFIDELSDLPLTLQPKLLRALEDREFSPVGSSKSFPVDCRIIAASQKELWNEVLAERFRRDLYFRLAVVTIPLPSLRERRADIPMLVEHFLKDLGIPQQTFEDLGEDLRARLLNHDWPGNIRELRNVIERLGVMGEEGLDWGVESGGPHPNVAPPAEILDGEGFELRTRVSVDRPYKEVKELVVAALEREYLERLLEATGNNVAAASRRAGLGRRHIYTLMEKHGLGTGREEED